MVAVEVERPFALAHDAHHGSGLLGGDAVVADRDVDVIQPVLLSHLELGSGAIDVDDRLDTQSRQLGVGFLGLGLCSAVQLVGEPQQAVYILALDVLESEPVLRGKLLRFGV